MYHDINLCRLIKLIFLMPGLTLEDIDHKESNWFVKEESKNQF